MGHNHWKIHDHRTDPKKTVYIGLFHRCEYALIHNRTTFSDYNLICNENKYCFHSNALCASEFPNTALTSIISEVPSQRWCNNDTNSQLCDYSSHTKGLVACTIISACFFSFSLILIYSHLLINEFEYRLHIFVSIITIILLAIAFIFMLATLITIGATLSFDLYQYHYDLNNRLHRANSNSSGSLKNNITNQAHRQYDMRTDWSNHLEITALILSIFILIIQILYLISTRRNRTG